MDKAKGFVDNITGLFEQLDGYSLDEKVDAINAIRQSLKQYSPFKDEPVDCVVWVKNKDVEANDYNPNSVAPPEMELLRLSIKNDGYTQPIVTWKDDDRIEVIDGFHRNRVGKECDDIQQRIHGYLPIVVVNDKQTDKKNRIASTIRHNRARGKHKVEAMSDIVLELKNRNWKNSRICKELGMEEDEVLRLCQITGLEDLFKDEEFSKSWDIADSYEDDEFEDIDDHIDLKEKEDNGFRTTNTSDENRIFHTYDKWECYKAGFYATKVDGLKKDECEQKFADFFKGDGVFDAALEKVTAEWVNSCEHYLTNTSMNRIAWLGQAAVCYCTGIPNKYSAGWFLLDEKTQNNANGIALKHLNKWLVNHDMPEIELNEALSHGRQVNIY